MYNIKEFMESAGVSSSSTTLIHSAFKKLSANNVEPYKFIEEIVSYFDGNGTILMPAMSWKSCTPSNPYFNVKSTPGNVGILAEIFRKNYAKFRSFHPTHSICGIGPKAESLLSQHEKAETPCSEFSPFRKLADSEGIILMIGVDLSACTLFHCAEEMIAKKVYLNLKPEKYICTNINGLQQIICVNKHKGIPRYYNKLKPLLEKSGVLRHGFYKGVEWISIKAKGSLQISLDALRRDPYYFYKNISD